MSLHPITKSRRTRKARGAYRSFHSRQEWKPWTGWNYHVPKNPLEWFGHKRFVLGIVTLVIILSGIVLAQGPLFHSRVLDPNYHGYDPTTLLWQSTGQSGNNAEFNTRGNQATFGTTAFNGCTNCKDIALVSSSTVGTEALTNASISSLSQSVAKDLMFSFNFYLVGNPTVNIPFYYFLTTNGTIADNQTTYNPLNDRNVAFAIQFDCTASCNASPRTYSIVTFLQLKPGDSINSELPTGVCTSSSSCYQSASVSSVNFDPLNTIILLQQYLNYTGGTTQNNPCNNSFISFGAGCSSQLALDQHFVGGVTTGRLTQPVTLSQSNYYVGIFTSPNLGSQLVTLYDTGTYISNTGANQCEDPASSQFLAVPPCNVRSLEADLVLIISTAPTPPPPTIDTGGFFGPIIKALISIGIFILNTILGFVSFIAPAIISAVRFLETQIESLLNFIGNALGFGNVGTQLFTFLGQVVAFFTNFLPTGLLNFPTFMSRFFDYLNIVFPILPSAFAIALTVLTFGVNGISQALTIVIFSIQFIAAAYAFFLIFSFMVFTADDALGGVVEYLGTAEALAFFLIKWAALLTNLGLDIGTWIIGLIPKPFIQMAAARLPRIPILESSARIILPSFDFGELRSGNLLSPWLWTLGFWFDTWYESRNPALPGSLCNLVPGTCTNMQLLSNLLPLMQVFVFMSSGVLALWLVMRPLELLGADLGIFESIGVGLGRKPVGGPGGISLAKSQKHFQGRLQKAVEKQKGVQGFKAVGPFSGAKLEKGIGTKEAVSTGSLLE